MVVVFAMYDQIVDVKTFNGNHLIDETITISGDLLAVIGNREYPCSQLCRVVITACARTHSGPVIRSVKTVLALICNAVNGEFGIVGLCIETIGDLAV